MPDPSPAFQFIADRGDARLRLDQVLVRRIRGVRHFSRTVARQWIEAGAVAIDGHVTPRAAVRVAEGAEVSVAIPGSAVRRERPQPESRILDVLYEDDHLIAVNKPAGMVVHPSYKQSGGTLLNALLGRLGHRSDLQPGILTRLDKGTSGIVIVALSPGVHAALQEQARLGQLTKEYLAVVRGAPSAPSGRISLPLGRDPADRRRVIVLASGAPSETVYEVMDNVETADGPASLVRCRLVTGRTHQIRVHLAASGSPVLGDSVYGAASATIDRQALHAWRVTLIHPVTSQPHTILAPLPEDIRALLEPLTGQFRDVDLSGRA
jgi:23S rRNA pseudouridine1911/1915/1917 synthase